MLLTLVLLMMMVLIRASPDDVTPASSDTDLQTTTVEDDTRCEDLRQKQEHLSLGKVMGKWHAVEIVHHQEPDGRDMAEVLSNSCPLLYLSRNGQQSIKLLWDEKAGLIEYQFRYPLISSPGFWVATSYQNGSLVDASYSQFTGTVQVMKAVASHVVLTFCSRPNGQLWSVVMARETRLNQAELKGVNNMLERRGLRLGKVVTTCRNSASRGGEASTNLAVLLALALAGFFL